MRAWSFAASLACLGVGVFLTAGPSRAAEPRPPRAGAREASLTRTTAAGLLFLLTRAASDPVGAAAPVGWRNDGTGCFPDASPPSEWSPAKNVLWKLALPGSGYGAPIVVGERLFVVSDPAELLCVRRSDGKVLWRKANDDVKAPLAGRGGPGAFGMGSSLAKPLLDALDADKDGKLTRGELVAGVKRFFKDCDKDKKGELDEKAIADGLSRILPAPRGFGPPGGRPGGPRGRRAPPGGPGGGLAGAIVKRAGNDKDGKLTLGELVAAAEALFGEVDKDKKGTLDEPLIAAGIDLLSPRPAFGPGARGGRPGGRGGFGPGGPGGSGRGAGNTAATPVSDGKHVAAVFGNGIVAVYTPEGKRLWGRFVESPRIGFGHSASPLLLQGKLIVHFKDLVALDVATGKEVWRVALPAAHASPVATRLGEEDVVISPAGSVVRARDGKVLARGEFRASQSSPVLHGDTIYLFERRLEAHKLSGGAGGEVSVTPLWSRPGPREMHHLPSPVVHEGLLYGVSTGGFLEVTDTRTGKEVYRQRLGVSQVYGSLALAGGLLYVADTRGRAVVVKPGRRFERVAVNELEGTGSCPVFAGDHLYVRGRQHLYCLSATWAGPQGKRAE
jgi:outer membrane protein assembly factor BamB